MTGADALAVLLADLVRAPPGAVTPARVATRPTRPAVAPPAAPLERTELRALTGGLVAVYVLRAAA